MTDIAVDICFNMDSGINSAKATRRYLKEFPAARYLILIIKQMLMQRYLNEVHTGGLGSYAILILVISFLQVILALSQRKSMFSRANVETSSYSGRIPDTRRKSGCFVFGILGTLWLTISL